MDELSGRIGCAYAQVVEPVFSYRTDDGRNYCEFELKMGLIIDEPGPSDDDMTALYLFVKALVWGALTEAGWEPPADASSGR